MMLAWNSIHGFLDENLRNEYPPLVQVRLELSVSRMEFVGNEVPRESSGNESFESGLEQVWRVLKGFPLR